MFHTVAISIALCGAVDTPPAPAAKHTGQSQLKCQTRWHQLDLPLKASGRLPKNQNVGSFFSPTQRDAQGSWKMRSEDASKLIRAIHDIQWDATPNGDAYRKWRGTGVKSRNVSVTGTLTVKHTTTTGKNEYQLSGTLTALDTGNFASRFGPNAWRDQWRHQFTGTIQLDDHDRVLSVQLSDEFSVDGQFSAAGKNTREGTLQLSIQTPAPLTDADHKKLLAMVARLGHEQFNVRETATAELQKWASTNESVSLALDHIQRKQTDPEILQRLKAIRERLK